MLTEPFAVQAALGTPGLSVITSIHAPRDAAFLIEDQRTLVLHPLMLNQLVARDIDERFAMLVDFITERARRSAARAIRRLEAEREVEEVDDLIEVQHYGGRVETIHHRYWRLIRED